MPNGAQLFASTLHQLEVKRIFTLVGDHLNDALEAVARSGIQVIDMRHESAVTHAADAHARITRKPAFALVTGGPGHTNALTGVATAHLACSPLIAVSGSRSRAVADRQAFQDIDQLGMTRPVVKWAAEPPSAAQIPFYLRRAWREAASGRQGAVHLTIPLDVFQAEADEQKIAGVEIPEPPAPVMREIERAAELIRASRSPVVIAGSGVWWARAEAELLRFIEATRLPLFTITMARGVLSDEHPCCFGYADPALSRSAHAAFQEADLYLVLGKRIDYRLGLGGARVLSPRARMIQVDIHPQELGLNRGVDVPICADLGASLPALTRLFQGYDGPPSSWIDRLRSQRTEWQSRLDASMGDCGQPIHPAAFYRELRRVLPPDALLSWDGGDFTHWGRAIIPARVPGAWLRLGPLGTIGSALPNAIALQLEHPSRRVFLITGDGALGFYIAEMDTAVRYSLPIITIVGNDAGWGLERELQQAQYASGARTVACELRPTRYDMVMRGFGGNGEHVETLEEIGPAVERALAWSGPYCINVNVRGVRSPFTEWQIEGKRAQR